MMIIQTSELTTKDIMNRIEVDKVGESIAVSDGFNHNDESIDDKLLPLKQQPDDGSTTTTTMLLHDFRISTMTDDGYHRNNELDRILATKSTDDMTMNEFSSSATNRSDTNTSSVPGGDNEEEIDTILSFVPAPYIVNMHQAPRFGHSNRMGLLVSSNPGDAHDYAGGLKQFTLFIVLPFFFWGVILLLFKYAYGLSKVGCAAGGDVLDMIHLAKSGVSRKQRRRRILRSWRLQTTFCILCVMIPCITMMMMEVGWKNLDIAWREVQDVVDDIETLGFKGLNVINGLQSTKVSLYQNILVQQVLAEPNPRVSVFDSWCPNASTSKRLHFFKESMKIIQENTRSTVNLLEDNISDNAANGFAMVTDVTQYVDESIGWFQSHDWMWKFLLMVINVLTCLMLLASFILSKNNLIHPPTRAYLSYLLVPMFTVCIILLLVATASTGIATLLNADFCNGGPDLVGTPLGTIEDAMLAYQHGSLDRKPLTGKMGLVYEAFAYYSSGCLTENPLEYLEDVAAKVDEAVLYIDELAVSLPNNTETMAALNLECGADVSFLPSTIQQMQEETKNIQSGAHAMVDLASCHQVSPLIRRITLGAICSESAYGLTWIWACSYAICVLSFVLLSTRAALYNTIKERKKRDKKPRRVVEKEFNEYKEFMAEYYDDAHEWQLDPPGKKKIIFDFGSQIRPNPTFETQGTDGDDDDDGEFSENAEIGQHHGDEEDYESSYGSSYESCSDDSHSDSDDDDEESALNSFISETKSLAMQTVQTLQKLKPLLGKLGAGMSYFGNSNDDDGEESEEDDDLMFEPETDIDLTKDVSMVDDSIYVADSPERDQDSPPGSPDGIWKTIVTPPGQILWGTSKGPGLLSVLTPLAPQKALASLARTDAVSEADRDELAPLTPASKRSPSSPSMDSDFVRPRQLRMSPLISPMSTPTDGQKRTRRRPRRQLDDEEDNNDYFTEHFPELSRPRVAPLRPDKVIRNFQRTRNSGGRRSGRK